MAADEMKTSILIQAETDDAQIKKEADNAANTVQKEFDKKRAKIEIEADIKDAQKNFNIALQWWKELKAAGASKVDLKVKSDELTAAADRLSKLKRELKETWEQAENVAGDESKGMGKLYKGLKNTAIWTAVISFVKKLASTLIELGQNYEATAEKFNRFTGDAEKTKELIDQLNNFASTNGLVLSSVRDTAEALLQMGVAADEIIPSLEALNGISLATGTSVEDLTDILKDVKEEGKLTTDSFNDLVKAGVPIGDQLAKDLGITVDEVKKLASEGKITEDQVTTAFKNMVDEWGVFADAMKDYSNSFEGKRNTLKNSFLTLGENIANGVMPAFEWLMDDAQQTADALTETGTQGLNGMQMIQKGLFAVVAAFRGLVKVIQSVGSIMGTIAGSSLALWQGFATDLGNTFSKLFSADAWEKLGDNIKYWIAKGVNGAIDAVNKLSERISQIPGISFWKIDHVSRGKKTEWGLFDFSNSMNALEGAKTAMKDTIKDLTEDREDFFKDTKEGRNDIGKTAEKTAKGTNATLNDLIKETTKKSGGSSKKASEDLVKQQKENLKKLRDVKIQEVQDSELTEKQKNEKLLDIYNWYKNELIKIDGKTNDELLKSAEDYIKEYYKKMEDASKKEQDLATESINKAKKYQDAIEKLGDKWDEYKDKATKNLREVNNEISELDKEFNKDIAERYNEVEDTIKKFERKNGSSEWLKSLSVDMLRNRDSDKISDIPVDDAIEYLNALKEQELLNGRLNEQQKELAKTLESQSESEKLIAEYEEKRAALQEQKNIYQAIANQWDLENIGKKAIELEGDIVKYYDATKDQYVEITDFKNQELARDLYNQQVKLESEYEQQQTALNNELELVKKHSENVLKQWQADTKAYQKELENRVDAVRKYVSEVQSLLASVPDSYRAYGGELNKWVTIVWENGPEAIVRRTAAYVQPRNAVQSYSTVNNNQSSFSINGMNVSVGNVDEFLAELKSRLTYRN